MKITSYFLFAGVVGSSSLASANAFNINEHDARVTGRGGATTASNTEASSVVFNPGGLALSDGINFAIDGTVYMAKGSYTLEGTTDKVNTDSSPAFVPALFATTRINDLVAVGIGLHFPFGLAISWPTDHPQADVIQDQALRTYFITPSVGFNLHKQVPGLAIGGGPDIVPATVELTRAVIFGDARGSAHLGGDAFGIGGRLGVMYHSPKLSQLKLGAMYRTPVKLDFAGKGDFDIADPYRAQLPPDGDISTSITLPMSLAIGAAYAATPELEVELNATWMDWSTFEKLTIVLPGDVETSSPEDYHDTITVRLGGEYALTKQKAALRAGVIYDPTPIPDTTVSAQLPDANRFSITVGGSKYFGNYGAHLGLLYLTPAERKTSDAMYTPQYKATYGITALVASLMVSGTIGK